VKLPQRVHALRQIATRLKIQKRSPFGGKPRYLVAARLTLKVLNNAESLLVSQVEPCVAGLVNASQKGTRTRRVNLCLHVRFLYPAIRPGSTDSPDGE
jgi:hypothetical protein